MTGPEVMDVARDAIVTLILVAAPLMLVGLLVGVVVSLLALLLWLGWACRILLIGASWAAVRRDAEVARKRVAPVLDSPAG